MAEEIASGKSSVLVELVFFFRPHLLHPVALQASIDGVGNSRGKKIRQFCSGFDLHLLHMIQENVSLFFPLLIHLGLHFLAMSQRHSVPSRPPAPGEPNTDSFTSWEKLKCLKFFALWQNVVYVKKY